MYAYYRSCGCSTSAHFISTSTTAGWSYCARCGDTMLPYIVNDSTGTTITDTFGLLPLKNWRWFHIFTDWLVNRIEAARDQVRFPLAFYRYQARASAAQQRRHKRKRFLLGLRTV